MGDRAQAAWAGAAAATVWALFEPLDRRIFRSDYSDVAVLGKFVTRGRWWRPAGLALHAANGAVFGLAFDELRRRLDAEPRRLALTLALAEHVALYPLSVLVDTRHPARGEPGLAPLLTVRAFAQATARHAGVRPRAREARGRPLSNVRAGGRRAGGRRGSPPPGAAA